MRKYILFLFQICWVLVSMQLKKAEDRVYDIFDLALYLLFPLIYTVSQTANKMLLTAPVFKMSLLLQVTCE